LFSLTIEVCMSQPDKAIVTEPQDADVMPLAAKAVRLQREALLPAERRGNMSHVTAACLMTGVASGLALATTLMAMQVADSVATQRHRSCPGMRVDWQAERAFLGVKYDRAFGAMISDVLPNTPASAIGLRHGDVIESVDGLVLSAEQVELKQVIQSFAPGSEVYLGVVRDGQRLTYRTQLTVLPAGYRE
jgi:predicted metalloprotease with PDZ domain